MVFGGLHIVLVMGPMRQFRIIEEGPRVFSAAHDSNLNNDWLASRAKDEAVLHDSGIIFNCGGVLIDRE